MTKRSSPRSFWKHLATVFTRFMTPRENESEVIPSRSSRPRAASETAASAETDRDGYSRGSAGAERAFSARSP